MRHSSKWIDGQVWNFGIEHEVWRFNEYVYKATYRNEFGFLPWGDRASPLEYMDRLELCNWVFGDRLELECVVGGEEVLAPIRFVTRQPFIEGKPLNQKDIEEYLTQIGFRKNMFGRAVLWSANAFDLPTIDELIESSNIVDELSRPTFKLWLGDLHSKNVIVTEESDVLVIDGIIAQATNVRVNPRLSGK